MAFIDTSVATNTTVKQTNTLAASSLVKNIGLVDVNAGLAQAADYQNKASAYLRSAIQSTFGTFDKTKTSLAAGISSKLSNIFKDTNVPSASTVSTAISDPVSTNLLSSRKPGATSFKIDGLQTGSQPITNVGSTTKGSGSVLMTGVNIITLINRLKVDVAAVKNLPGTIASRFTSQRLNGLFAGATVAATGAIAGQIGDPLLGAFISSAASSALVTTLGINATGSINSGSNDFQSFLGRISPLQAALGGKDLSSYYLTNSTYSLTDELGNPVYTNKSGVDSATANSILGIVKNLGCSISQSEYLSSNNLESLFGLGLILSALEGMENLVDELLNCSHATSRLGQQSLGRAFGEVSGSQVGIAKSILDRVDAPTTLNTADLGISILTNPSLSTKDKGTVDSIFSTLGTSTKQAMTVPSVSSSRYPVYDGSVIPKIQLGFTNSVFQDTTITDYFQGRKMVIGSDGKLSYI